MNTGNTKAKRTRRVLAGTFFLAAVLGTVLTFARTDNPTVSSEWPRPYDPAKPFNMLGVPGVSVEQRKRAEDLLVRSLQEAPRWSDFQATMDAGWYHSALTIAPTTLQGSAASDELREAYVFEHIINPSLFNDGRMLDPEYPESLVYKVRNGERIFFAYMYIAEPGIPLDDPRIAGFAGRLIEWHNHSDVCWQHDDERRIDILAGSKAADGTCSTEGGGPVNSLTPEVPAGDPGLDLLSESQRINIRFSTALMIHVWVVERRCGPFSAMEGPLGLGVSTTPLDERVDVCKH